METKRSFKAFPLDSVGFSKKLGGVILKNINDIKVDVHNPEVLVQVEIREKHLEKRDLHGIIKNWKSISSCYL